MERARARARACLAAGAVAAAIAALTVGGPSLVRAAVIAVEATPAVAPASEGHTDPTPQPSPAPVGTPAPVEADAHGHGDAVPSPDAEQPDAMPSDHDMPSNHEAMPSGHEGMGDVEHGAGASDDHAATDQAGGHAGADGAGHGDEEPPVERPREAVLGGFFAVNGLVLAAAAITRRRDRAKAAARSATALGTPTQEDASR